MLAEVTKIIRSGLNRKLASTVFFSILLVEFILLIPSVVKYKESQVQMVQMHADILINALDSALLSGGVVDAKKLSRYLENYETVRGFSICGKDGCLTRYGEGVDSTSEMTGKYKSELLENLSRMEVTRRLKTSGESLWIVLRIDSSIIRKMVDQYTWNTLGLIALIAIFVTFTALVGIALIVINPILKLKKTMHLAMEDPTQPTKYILENTNNDEIADLTQTYNRLLFDISHYQDQLTESKRKVERGLS